MEKNVHAINIETPDDLRKIGAEEAWLQIPTQVDKNACFHQLQALARAAEEIPKKKLSPERKAELKSFFDSHK